MGLFSSDPSSEETAKARASVFRQLKIRHRSEKEIRTKLLDKKFSVPIIEETVRYFKALDLIDDQRFARAWIQSRLKKPFGVKRIRLELKDKGIHKDIIADELERATADYPQEEIVLQLARRRQQKYLRLPVEKRKRRIFEYLARRGFDSGIIWKTIRQLNDNDS